MKSDSNGDAENDVKLLKVARAVDEFECYADSHAERVAELSAALAAAFNFARGDRLALREAALLHDVGERAMNREYIRARRALTAAERIDVERHTVIGEQAAAHIGLSRAAQLLIRFHHEWWNGAGYPDALQREQIPLAARILRVADTFAALTAARPFRAAFSDFEARQYLIENAAVEFDPSVVRAFVRLEDSAAEKADAEIAESPPAADSFVDSFDV